MLFNQAMPLSVRKEAALRPFCQCICAANWRSQPGSRQRCWTRWPWRKTAAVVAAQVPELKPYLDAYVAAPSTDAKKFAAVFLILKYPGARPYVDEGLDG